MAKAKSIIVTVTDDALDKIQTVARQLGSKGMKVNKVHPITGVISGSIDAGKMGKLSSVKGVHSVEHDAAVQLPDPNSEIQ